MDPNAQPERVYLSCKKEGCNGFIYVIKSASHGTPFQCPRCLNKQKYCQDCCQLYINFRRHRQLGHELYEFQRKRQVLMRNNAGLFVPGGKYAVEDPNQGYYGPAGAHGDGDQEYGSNEPITHNFYEDQAVPHHHLAYPVADTRSHRHNYQHHHQQQQHHHEHHPYQQQLQAHHTQHQNHQQNHHNYQHHHQQQQHHRHQQFVPTESPQHAEAPLIGAAAAPHEGGTETVEVEDASDILVKLLHSTRNKRAAAAVDAASEHAANPGTGFPLSHYPSPFFPHAAGSSRTHASPPKRSHAQMQMDGAVGQPSVLDAARAMAPSMRPAPWGLPPPAFNETVKNDMAPAAAAFWGPPAAGMALVDACGDVMMPPTSMTAAVGATSPSGAARAGIVHI